MIASPSPPDEFYIGYEDHVPCAIRRQVRRFVVVAGCAALAGAALAVAAAGTLPASRFEFGVVTEIEGSLRRIPYPVLDTASGRVWLAGQGKWGAERVLAGVPDGPVMLRGSRVQRGEHRMLEVHSVGRSARVAGAAPTFSWPLTNDEPPPLNHVVLAGEIVDSKCFLGVMNPAEGAVHRDCARRCLSGGMPPMLLVRGTSGREELVVLVSATGRPLARESALVAGAPVEVAGRLTRDGEDYVLYVSGWKKGR